MFRIRWPKTGIIGPLEAFYDGKAFIGTIRCKSMREESWSLAGDCVLRGTLYVPDEYATAMIALHGFTGNRHSLKSYCRVLCQDKLVLALDQRGHGESEGKVDIAAMARDIGRILDDMRERGASSVALLGHSMGGLDARYMISRLGMADKVATLVAGYNAADTTNAAKYVTTQTVDTMVGKKYKGTSATQATLVTETAATPPATPAANATK